MPPVAGPPLQRPPVRFRSYALTYGLITVFLILLHGPLLELPFYWDEAGQFVPASLDLFRTGAWIPVSTVPNVHPPGVMAYLAAFWFIFGYSITGTRVAMLLIAGLGALVTLLLGIELSRGARGTPAFAGVALLCLSPLFFAQSMLAQLDMPAMCLSILALLLFLQDRVRASAVACAALVLVKETGVVAPVVFGAWLLCEGRGRKERLRASWFLLPLPCLVLWLAILHRATGHWFGNAAFAAYNVSDPLHPVRILLALGRRFYYLFIGTGHFIGTAAVLWAWRRMPLLRTRAWYVAGSFVLAHVVAVSALGGAVLERYLLPALPIVYVAFAISLGSLMPRTRKLTLAALIVCLAAASFLNPLYPFPFENNLAFVGFVELEASAAQMVEQHGPGIVATAFPVADALRNPDFGYVQVSHNVTEVADFSGPEIEKLRNKPPEMLVVYDRTWDPLHVLDYPPIAGFLTRQYGYQRELGPDEIARTLSMRVARRWTRRGLSMALLEAVRQP